MLVIKRVEQVQYRRILDEVGDDGLLVLPELENDIVICETDVKQALLLHTEQVRLHHLNALMSIKKRLETHHYSVQLAHTTAEVIGAIHDSKNVEDVIHGASSATDQEQAFLDLIECAYKLKASDIHIVRNESSVDIKFRVNKVLVDSNIAWSVSKADAVIAVAYNTMGINKDIKWDHKRYQDADMTVRLEAGHTLRLRYAHGPSKADGTWGATIRLLKQDDKTLSLQQLGYTELQQNDINKALLKATGVIIIAGTTNSGKSTTARTLLSSLYEESKGTVSILTVEDPPEYNIPGAVQIPVIRSKDDNDPDHVNFFAKAIRNAMRRDPDIIFIGEIRDEETARALVQAVQSGHRVITTIHAATAFGVVNRLEQLGVDRDTLGSPNFIAGIIYQKLVPTLCDQAIEVDVDSAEAASLMNHEVREVFRKALPDEHRKVRLRDTSRADKGVCGMTLCAEVLRPDFQILRNWREGHFIESLQYFRDKGGKFAIDHALERVMAGQLDPHDAMEVFSDQAELNMVAESEDGAA